MIKIRAKVLPIISLAMVVALIIVLALSLKGASESTRSMDEVAPSVLELFENEKTGESTSRFVKKYYGLNTADYEAVVYYSPISNMDAEELLIVKLKDSSQAQVVKDAMEARKESQINVFEGYAPEQLLLCQEAIIDLQANYIMYVVHSDAGAIVQAFRQALK